jgi:diacylglycerol kinase family enzyme
MNEQVLMNNYFLVTNSQAGSGESAPPVFESFHTVELNDVAATVANAATAPNDSGQCVIAVWGGDGTCRSVAQHTVGTNVAFLPAPGGTFSHFAKEAGFATVADVESGLQNMTTHSVDAAFVNDEIFLNNASIGWYVDLLTRRQRYERTLPRKVAKLASVVVQLFRTRRVRIRIDGVEERVWMLWVGNGIYSSESGAIPERECLDDGVLDVRILRSGARLPKLNALAAVLRKNTPSSSLVEHRRVVSCQVHLPRPETQIALDGEIVTISSPLNFECRPKSLLLVAPPATS